MESVVKSMKHSIVMIAWLYECKPWGLDRLSWICTVVVCFGIISSAGVELFSCSYL